MGETLGGAAHDGCEIVHRPGFAQHGDHARVRHCAQEDGVRNPGQHAHGDMRPVAAQTLQEAQAVLRFAGDRRHSEVSDHHVAWDGFERLQQLSRAARLPHDLDIVCCKEHRANAEQNEWMIVGEDDT
nr:hypothetical protein [Paraburkholderia nodosa]